MAGEFIEGHELDLLHILLDPPLSFFS